MRPGDTPVPIPNTMVKTRTADGTALETVWESRWPPDQKKINEREAGELHTSHFTYKSDPGRVQIDSSFISELGIKKDFILIWLIKPKEERTLKTAYIIQKYLNSFNKRTRRDRKTSKIVKNNQRKNQE